MQRKLFIIIVLIFCFILAFILIFKNNDNKTSTLEEKTISKFDDIYSNELTKDYLDIRNIPEDYTLDSAINDNCFIIGTKSINEDLYKEFINNYNNNISSFIRIVQTTVEGDLIIIDILYDENQVYLVKDDTRDEYSSIEDRTIKYLTYESLGILDNYFIAYNNKLPLNINDIDEDNVLIIANLG